ncbi:uncharacterized protein TRIADDRAFT_55048 [Trichoplax adhaerens]|uniref:Uncharacterized protein n=1 Tax=Trichoplax adhaerens TaxID=10228 RepID=B3RQN0_TRIAD|nr:hypothetical protein TRIADDRAFT_55048 [Trichoplax adhaerens]EDV26723.1 hypothetical protein TRIADDRAFT_55048 [Trichoplax adhaerens]|eukprot:XP_002110719.1 hypothetical protein TRIADDRAFT_55048 [Trichoplax adhaerens]
MEHSTETPIDDEDNDELHITLLIWIMVAVLVITALVSLFVFVFKKGKPDNKEDMVGLLASESDITDYEDLCRQHVASKKSEMVDGASGKIITIGDAEQVTEGLDSVATSWSHEPVTADMDISTCHVVLSYMEDHLKNKDRLMKEWEALLRYKVDRSSGLVASRAVNIRLNRYSDTFPYDHNRVVLTTSPTNDNDYINASYIYDHNPRNPMYIATQGPIPNTKAHFWQMVWEQKIATVVMLARLKENDVAVCALYWPEKKGKECYGDFEVTLVSEHNWCDDYVVRNFYLRNIKNQETRTVTQFQYLSWPDMGIPKDTKNFLEFRRKINRSYHGQGCPVIIHCNDGAGRAGTYILIDMTLKRLSKGTKEIDIAATIEHLRDQRISMVKTKVQFEFALSSIAEEVNDILNALK